MNTGIIQSYLEKVGRPYSWLSKRSGVSVPHLVHINSAKRKPSIDTLQRLNTATNGKIKPNDFIRIWKGHRKPRAMD